MLPENKLYIFNDESGRGRAGFFAYVCYVEGVK